MIVTAKIDRFGRILIPKTLREILGLSATDEVTLQLTTNCQLLVSPANPPQRPQLRVDELGIPIFHFGTGETMRYDFTAAIAGDREQRGLSSPTYD